MKNSLKFTKEGTITIKASYNDADRCLVVHVCDTGVGIAPADIPKLFTRFGKLHRTVLMNSNGIGLGLTIVKQIVEAANGEIEVKSDGVGHGTTFLLSMQIEKGHEEDNLEEDEEAKNDVH